MPWTPHSVRRIWRRDRGGRFQADFAGCCATFSRMSEKRSNFLASNEAADQRRNYRIERRTFWVSVVASIVASIVFGLFFQPIVNGISNAIVSTIGVFYAGYLDKLYFDAAQNPADLLIFMVFAMIMSLPPILYAGLSFSSLLRRRTTDRTQRRITRLIGVVLPMMMIALFIIAAGPAVSIRANSTFQRRLMALAPVITEDERKQVLGNWAMMSSKADYLAINAALEQIAKKHNTDLPKRAQ
jgi:cytochrome bd-type quinol oxidase subunit 2